MLFEPIGRTLLSRSTVYLWNTTHRQSPLWLVEAGHHGLFVSPSFSIASRLMESHHIMSSSRPSSSSSRRVVARSCAVFCFLS